MVHDAARRVGDRHGLPPDWLNDGVKGFLPGTDPNATFLFDKPGLAVRLASPRYLFAMKVLAARVERDEDDLRLLYELRGFRSVEEALDPAALMTWVSRSAFGTKRGRTNTAARATTVPSPSSTLCS